jgi:hypothetical protein
MLPNAASIRLYGADNADRMRGLYFDGVALDEPADMAPRVWGEVIRPTLSDRGGWATFIGTPKGHNAFWDLWKRAERDPDWFSLRLKASETGLLPSVELAAARADLSEDQYEQEYETSFDAAIIGAILGRQISMAEREGRISDDVTYDPDGAPIEISSDIGRRDASAWWFWQPVVGGYRVVDFDLDSGLWAEEWINRLQNRIKAKGYKLGKIHLPHDARAKTFAAKHSVVEQFLMKYGPEIVRITPDSSKEDRINAARRVTSRCEFAASACAEGLDGLRSWQYEYDDERKEFSREPRHDWASHPGDAFSYGALILEERQPAPAPAPKPRFLAVGEANAVTLNDMWQSVQRPSERI